MGYIPIPSSSPPTPTSSSLPSAPLTHAQTKPTPSPPNALDQGQRGPVVQGGNSEVGRHLGREHGHSGDQVVGEQLHEGDGVAKEVILGDARADEQVIPGLRGEREEGRDSVWSWQAFCRCATCTRTMSN